MKPNKKVSTPAPAPSLSNKFYSSSSSDDDYEPYTLAKKLPQALKKALESAVVNMKWLAQEKPARL